MPMVYIECPTTGEVISTNHIVADTEKLRHRSDKKVLVACPACGSEHVWTEQNGFFLTPAEASSRSNGAIGL